jgi:Glycosyltransferase Family 4
MKILVLCTYPISIPKHGGQLRVRNIVDRYRAAGHEVEVVGVLGSDAYQQESGFIAFPGEADLRSVLANPFLMEDYAIGRLFADDRSANARLASTIRAKPDVVQVEHPWLFAFAKEFVQTKAPSARLIYSSHNVEWRLKQEILSSYYDADVAQHAGELIKDIELACIVNSDAVVCVSASDADWVRSQAEKLVLANN